MKCHVAQHLIFSKDRKTDERTDRRKETERELSFSLGYNPYSRCAFGSNSILFPPPSLNRCSVRLSHAAAPLIYSFSSLPFFLPPSQQASAYATYLGLHIASMNAFKRQTIYSMKGIFSHVRSAPVSLTHHRTEQRRIHSTERAIEKS